MAKTTSGKSARQTSKTEAARPQREQHDGVDAVADTAIRYLSPEELAKLSMDSWEPSLLRHMLRAASTPKSDPKT